MSTPLVTARRNLVQRINKLLLRGDEVSLTAWQLSHLQGAIAQLEEGRFADGERTMSEAERPDLYEPSHYVAERPIERQRLIEQLKAVLAAA